MIADPRFEEISSLIQAGEKDQARRVLSDVLRERPDSADAWYWAAYITDDRAKRIQALEKALALNPAHEKALKALTVLKDDDPLNDFLAAPTSSAPPTPAQQPVVYVNVTNTTSPSPSTVIGGTTVNSGAFWVGFLVSLLTGIYGVSHLMTGKVGGALGAFLAYSILWPILAFVLIVISAGICLLAVLPLHIYLAYTVNQRGASLSTVTAVA